MRAFVSVCLLLAVSAGALSGCVRTQYYERENLVDHCAQFDPDTGVIYLRNKIEAAREGGFGGFGGSAAGGCGCQ